MVASTRQPAADGLSALFDVFVLAQAVQELLVDVVRRRAAHPGGVRRLQPAPQHARMHADRARPRSGGATDDGV